MPLQQYVRQVKHRNESYTPPVEKIQTFLTESSTADATNAEMAICYQYNYEREHQGVYAKPTDDEDIDVSKSSGTEGNYGKFKKLLGVAEKVVDSLGDRGKELIHAGTSTGNNKYEKGTDNTSKSDLNGDSANHISLKKQGDSGAGAQLMSAKSGEAEGVLVAAIKHYNASSDAEAGKRVMTASIKKLFAELKETEITNEIEVENTTKNFTAWYFKNRTIGAAVYGTGAKITDTYKIGKEGENFLKAELKLHGNIGLVRTAEKTIEGFLKKHVDRQKKPLEHMLSKNEYDDYVTAYSQDSTWDVGGIPKAATTKAPAKFNKPDEKGIQVSARHFFGTGRNSQTFIKGWPPEGDYSAALKKQAVQLLDIKAKAPAFQEELRNFFKDDNMKKWMVFEAATGHYKFTGTTANNTTDNNLVANRILVFSNDGVVADHSDMKAYADGHKNLIDKLQVNFKSSARSKSLTVRVQASGYEPIGNFLLEKIVEEEAPVLEAELYQLKREMTLSEGLFKDIADKVKKYTSLVSNAVTNFFKKIWEKFEKFVLDLVNKGIDAVLEAFGLEWEGGFSMKTPSW